MALITRPSLALTPSSRSPSPSARRANVLFFSIRHSTYMPIFLQILCTRDAPLTLGGHSVQMQAGAAEKGVPLYKHIAELAGNPKLARGIPKRA